MQLSQEVPAKTASLVRLSDYPLIWLLLLTTAGLAFCKTNKTESLRIGSWNIEWFRPEFRPNSPKFRTNKDFQALKKVIDTIKPDILAVQEVESREFLQRVAEPDHYTSILENRDSDQRTGFLIRKSIVWKRHPDVSLNIGHDGLRLGVHIELPGRSGSLHLLSIHLASGCWATETSLNSSQTGCLRLKRQLPTLKKWLHRYGQGNNQVVILGDFNRRLNANDAVWQHLTGKQTGKHRIHLLTGEVISRCPASLQPQALIDHIVISAPPDHAMPSVTEFHWSKKTQKNQLMSDHCPLYMDLPFPR